MAKGTSGGLSMILKTRLEVAQDYTVFNYVPPIPQKDLKSQDIKILAGPGMKTTTIFFSQGTATIKLVSNPPRCIDHG